MGNNNTTTLLVVVDMQKDFVNGSLGSKEAQAIVAPAAEYIRGFDGDAVVTYDTHHEDYLETPEGKKLPVRHCIFGSDGWELAPEISDALSGKSYEIVKKETFGSTALPAFIQERFKKFDRIELLGLCTDICVISNALILKNSFPDVQIAVHASLCAGVTPAKHEAALEVMRSCQIDII